jgi:hypothetical protein
VEGWGEAASGHVKVCVGPSGILKKVELDPRAMRMPSENLAASIVEAAQGAQRAAAVSIREIYSSTDTGGIDIAAVAQGEYDASAEIEQRLAKAREALRQVR